MIFRMRRVGGDHTHPLLFSLPIFLLVNCSNFFCLLFRTLAIMVAGVVAVMVMVMAMVMAMAMAMAMRMLLV